MTQQKGRKERFKRAGGAAGTHTRAMPRWELVMDRWGGRRGGSHRKKRWESARLESSGVRDVRADVARDGMR